MTLLQIDPAWAVACAFILSLCVGSFLNVVIHRLPIMMEKEWLAEHQDEADTEQETYNLSSPDSTCPQCGHKIRWYENIPVVSYLILRFTHSIPLSSYRAFNRNYWRFRCLYLRAKRSKSRFNATVMGTNLSYFY